MTTVIEELMVRMMKEEEKEREDVEEGGEG